MSEEGRRRPLATGATEIWLCDPDEVSAPDLQARACELLDDDERRRYERFRVERGRRLFLAGRALVRTTLSRYAAVDPHDWRFRFGDHGRPEILAPATSPPLSFNLSHTDGLVACAVTLGAELGVDVEATGRARKLRRLADHTFAASEAADVHAASELDRRRRFFSYWTLKEAYVKARGEGMSLPLKRFAFAFPAPGRITARFDREVDADGSAWGFALFEASPDHLLAIARRPASGVSDLAAAYRVRPPAAGARPVALRRLGTSG